MGNLSDKHGNQVLCCIAPEASLGMPAGMHDCLWSFVIGWKDSAGCLPKGWKF